MKKLDLSIIIVNYNNKDKIENLLKSIQNHTKNVTYEIIVIDNFYSSKVANDLQSICKNYKNTHLIRLNKNYGYGFANNEAIKFAKSENIFILNPDIEIKNNIFANMLQKLEKLSNPVILVPNLQTKQGKPLKNTRNFPSIWSLFIRRLFGETTVVNAKKDKVIDWAQGSFWVIKKSVFENLGGFDTNFFLFFEDTDFCKRLAKSGGKVIKTHNEVAIHSSNRLSGGFIFFAIFRWTFWVHIWSAIKYFWKWKK